MTSDPNPRLLDRLVLRAAAWVRDKVAAARVRRQLKAAAKD